MFCRNPGDYEDTPWCYVDDRRTVKENCQIPQCGKYKKTILGRRTP